jgi:hypothetical protein
VRSEKRGEIELGESVFTLGVIVVRGRGPVESRVSPESPACIIHEPRGILRKSPLISERTRSSLLDIL